MCHSSCEHAAQRLFDKGETSTEAPQVQEGAKEFPRSAGTAEELGTFGRSEAERERERGPQTQPPPPLLPPPPNLVSPDQRVSRRGFFAF